MPACAAHRPLRFPRAKYPVITKEADRGGGHGLGVWGLGQILRYALGVAHDVGRIRAVKTQDMTDR